MFIQILTLTAEIETHQYRQHFSTFGKPEWIMWKMFRWLYRERRKSENLIVKRRKDRKRYFSWLMTKENIAWNTFCCNQGEHKEPHATHQICRSHCLKMTQWALQYLHKKQTSASKIVVGVGLSTGIWVSVAAQTVWNRLHNVNRYGKSPV